MNNPGPDPSGKAGLPKRSLFDEQAYLQLYPDIAEGVAAGAIESGWSHFSRSGFAEGRAWVPRQDPYAGVSQVVSPNDEMHAGNTTHYFEVGESALHSIEVAIQAARLPRSAIKRILDLPCGHGRVMRFLHQRFPDAELVACDLNRDGVDFCAQTFDAVPEYSRADPEQIPHQGVVDLIWCGSLLTHLSEQNCRAFLQFFHRILSHQGLLVVTVHGRFCARELASGRNRHNLAASQIKTLLDGYQQRGFSYVPYEAGSDYGFSLSHPSFVAGELIDDMKWRMIGYHESGWDNRQDVVCLQKSLQGRALGI